MTQHLGSTPSGHSPSLSAVPCDSAVMTSLGNFHSMSAGQGPQLEGKDLIIQADGPVAVTSPRKARSARWASARRGGGELGQSLL